jgi:hypothetical protein
VESACFILIIVSRAAVAGFLKNYEGMNKTCEYFMSGAYHTFTVRPSFADLATIVI